MLHHVNCKLIKLRLIKIIPLLSAWPLPVSTYQQNQIYAQSILQTNEIYWVKMAIRNQCTSTNLHCLGANYRYSILRSTRVISILRWIILPNTTSLSSLSIGCEENRYRNNPQTVKEVEHSPIIWFILFFFFLLIWYTPLNFPAWKSNTAQTLFNYSFTSLIFYHFTILR